MHRRANRGTERHKVAQLVSEGAKMGTQQLIGIGWGGREPERSKLRNAVRLTLRDEDCMCHLGHDRCDMAPAAH